MTDYKKLWNDILPTTDMELPDALISVSEESLNHYLRQHRKYDPTFYYRKEEFNTGPVSLSERGKRLASKQDPYFKLEICVGAEVGKTEDDPQPFSIHLFDSPDKVDDALPKSKVVTYSYVNNLAAKSNNNDMTPNVMIKVPNVNFRMEWPNYMPDGKPWIYEFKNINFTLKAYIELQQVDNSTEEDDKPIPQSVLEIVPLELSVTQGTMNKLTKQLKASLKDRYEDGNILNDQINDLFYTLMKLGAAKIGPNMVQSIPLPVAQVSGHVVYPSFLQIHKKVITIGAQLKTADEKIKEIQRIVAKQELLESYMDTDIKAAGGWEAAFYTKESVKKYHTAINKGLSSESCLSLLKHRPKRECSAILVRSSKLLQEIEDELIQLQQDMDPSSRRRSQRHPHWTPRRNQRRESNQRPQVEQVELGMAVAINQHFFSTGASLFKEISKSSHTKELKLFLIKGRLAYRLYVGNPTITVMPEGKLESAIETDAWAGLQYSLMGDGCKPTWGRWREVGLGIKGKPGITMSMKTGNGLRIKAKFVKGGLKLYTGLGSPIDDLVGDLSGYFVDAFKVFFDGLAHLLSFVVIPIEFAPGRMNTALTFRHVESDTYIRTGDEVKRRGTYLMATATVRVKKV